VNIGNPLLKLILKPVLVRVSENTVPMSPSPIAFVVGDWRQLLQQSCCATSRNVCTMWQIGHMLRVSNQLHVFADRSRRYALVPGQFLGLYLAFDLAYYTSILAIGLARPHEHSSVDR
jgi:hypothetical protein